MKYYQNTKIITSVLLLPLLITTLVMGYINLSNANNDALDMSSLPTGLPVLGYFELSINGADVVGETETAGLEDHIEFYTYRHDIKGPRDPSTGRLTGRIEHSPIIITKQIDSASVELIMAIHLNQIVEATFKFYSISEENNNLELIYSVSITAGSISQVRTLSILDETDTYVVEEVSFVYETVTFQYHPDGEEFVYNWVDRT